MGDTIGAFATRMMMGDRAPLRHTIGGKFSLVRIFAGMNEQQYAMVRLMGVGSLGTVLMGRMTMGMNPMMMGMGMNPMAMGFGMNPLMTGRWFR